MKFPVTVVKGSDEALVLHAVDLQGWLKDGWKIKQANLELVSNDDKKPTRKVKSEGGK